ncbi:hypothetical protein ElyMa_000107000 [Elysia marginata]|uniref:Uncharacterized protein n=1 Tax=Elysia marginata TaxID=1093978 RepID=A0AAV4EKF6_9GAST|nr:hypothetical protein ElyMa_000107000 [Elysia marginata]
MKNVFVKILGTEKKRSSEKKKCLPPPASVITPPENVTATSTTTARVSQINRNNSNKYFQFKKSIATHVGQSLASRYG